MFSIALDHRQSTQHLCQQTNAQTLNGRVYALIGLQLCVLYQVIGKQKLESVLVHVRRLNYVVLLGCDYHSKGIKWATVPTALSLCIRCIPRVATVHASTTVSGWQCMRD